MVVEEEVEEKEEEGRNPLVERSKRARASMVAFDRQGARYISRVCQHARTGQGTETKRDRDVQIGRKSEKEKEGVEIRVRKRESDEAR